MNKYLIVILAAFLAACGMKGKSNATEEEKASSAKFTRLVWSDEFDADTLNTAKWSAVEGNGCPDFCGFGNNEKQYYTDNPENVRVENGILTIRARKDTLGSSPYSSAKLITKNKGDWKYGRIEVRAKLPEGRGTWPAIWMLPTVEGERKWPLDGEIDIMEHVGYNQGTVYGTVHTQLYNHMVGTQKSDSIYLDDLSETFHTYALEWDEKTMSWFVDDENYLTLEKASGETYEGWPFDQEHHLIINVAVGGNWGGKFGIDETIWPQQMEVDYVRVYQ